MTRNPAEYNRIEAHFSLMLVHNDVLCGSDKVEVLLAVLVEHQKILREVKKKFTVTSISCNHTAVATYALFHLAVSICRQYQFQRLNEHKVRGLPHLSFAAIGWSQVEGKSSCVNEERHRGSQPVATCCL